ncbi:MAG: hypothetical protein RIR69_921 [Actinomycetota bacterium]
MEECPEPVRRAVMVQQWKDLSYIHWRYDPAEVQSLLPAGLEVDTFDGSAWVGLIPFSMRGIGVPGLPAVPYFGSFPEVNVRTYVRRHGVPGVWFFSLDVNRLLPALVARATYLLPYCWGSASNRIDKDQVSATVVRRWPHGASTSIHLTIGDRIQQPDDLAVFLSARWGLYSRGIRGGLRYAPVDHEKWPLYSAQLVAINDTLVVASGLSAPQGEAHVMFSPGVSVRVGRPRRA